jgi:hypothetical protein
MLKPLEARYHRLHPYDAKDVPGLRTVAGPVLCGCASCGDELAEVVLMPSFTGTRELGWIIEVLRGYSRAAPGIWRWSRHAARSKRGMPHNAARPNFWQPLEGVITRRGELVVNGPNGRYVHNRGREHEGRFKQIALLMPGDSITISCQQASPHMSRLSYDGLMREAAINIRG